MKIKKHIKVTDVDGTVKNADLYFVVGVIMKVRNGKLRRVVMQADHELIMSKGNAAFRGIVR